MLKLAAGFLLCGGISVATAQDQCLADGGFINGAPEPCNIPFTYKLSNGTEFEVFSCEETRGLLKFTNNNLKEPSDDATNMELWCSTSAIYNPDNKNRRKNWGYCLCPSDAPTVSPSLAPSLMPTQTSSPTALPSTSPSISIPGGISPTMPGTSAIPSRSPTRGNETSNPDLEEDQVAVVSIAVVTFTTSAGISLLALLTCAAQSMRRPIEDISSSNIAAKLAYHYDRAGVLGGCLTSSMGWREAAILLSGTGKLPHLLFSTRIASIVVALVELALIFSSYSCQSCFSRYFIIFHTAVAILWAMFAILSGSIAAKWFNHSRSQGLRELGILLQDCAPASCYLIVDFAVFVLAATAGFTLLVNDEIDNIALAASSMALLSAILYILGPCAASHTSWIGQDLMLLTPRLEFDHESDDESTSSDHLEAAQKQQSSTWEQKASVTQMLLRGEKPWATSEVFARSVLVVTSIVGAVLFALGSDVLNAILLLCVLGLESSRLIGDFFASRSKPWETAKPQIAPPPSPVVVNASAWSQVEGFQQIKLNIRTSQQNQPKNLCRNRNIVVLTWKNTFVGRLLVLAEGALLCLVVIGVSIASSTEDVSNFNLPATLGTIVALLLSITFIFSYIACFGYAGGELNVPQDRLSMLMRNKSSAPDNVMERADTGFKFQNGNKFQPQKPPQEISAGECTDSNRGSKVMKLVRKHSSNTLNALKRAASSLSNSGGGSQDEVDAEEIEGEVEKSERELPVAVI